MLDLLGGKQTTGPSVSVSECHVLGPSGWPKSPGMRAGVAEMRLVGHDGSLSVGGCQVSSTRWIADREVARVAHAGDHPNAGIRSVRAGELDSAPMSPAAMASTYTGRWY